MTHQDHLSLHKGRLLVSQAEHEELSRLHKSVARHLEVKDPKLSRLHQDIAGIHQDAASHLAEVADSFGDVEPTAKTEGGSLNVLHKVLIGSE